MSCEVVPKPSVSDSSSLRLQGCQRRAPLIPPVLGSRLSFVKLKIFPPGTSFCQRLNEVQGDGVSVSLPDSDSVLFPLSRETDKGQWEQRASVIFGPRPAVHLSPASTFLFILLRLPSPISLTGSLALVPWGCLVIHAR
jgi:hypothetical protein